MKDLSVFMFDNDRGKRGDLYRYMGQGNHYILQQSFYRDLFRSLPPSHSSQRHPATSVIHLPKDDSYL